jgi:hypothetical protein
MRPYTMQRLLITRTQQQNPRAQNMQDVMVH